jgi:GDPmannose 4,6-dehydratase
VVRIKAGLETDVYTGNLDAVRDWDCAPEYVEAMWLPLQHDSPNDYVVATGDVSCVRDFVRFSFEHAALDWEEHVRFDERYLRPTELDSLIGDSTRARQALGWEPKVRTPELARIISDADMAALETEGTTWVHRAWARG